MDAVSAARRYTFPVVILTRTWGGTMAASCGSFVVVNAEGWFVTARHLLDAEMQARGDLKHVGDLRAEIDSINGDETKSLHRRARAVAEVEGRADPDWIASYVCWWASPHARFKSALFLPRIDVAIARLDPVDPDLVAAPAVLKNPSLGDMQPGRSLCRLGFPFVEPGITYDEVTGEWDLDAAPVVPMPLEGMLTRNFKHPDHSDEAPLLYLETSSPGLPGHSGGPVFDTRGRVWGIQSATRHAKPAFSVDTYFSQGIAVQSATVMHLLDALGVAYRMSDD